MIKNPKRSGATFLYEKHGDIVKFYHQIHEKQGCGEDVFLPAFWGGPKVPNALRIVHFGVPFLDKCPLTFIKHINKNHEKTITEKQDCLCQKGVKLEPKSMPKLIENQCQNWYRTNHEKHRKSCYSEM